jgi:hypothetical protein
MNPRLRLWLKIIATVVVIFLVCAAITAWLTRYQWAYSRLAPGTPKAEVLKWFGKPRYIRECELSPSWDDEPLDKSTTKCAEEFWYFSRIGIDQWVVGLDANGRTVTKYHLSSP